MIKTSAILEFEGSGMGPMVSCPACPAQAIGDSCMAHAMAGAESYIHENRLAYRIPFNCENGHVFWLHIRNRKGNTQFETEFIGLYEIACEYDVEGEE